ncbi:MAG: acyl-CoA dehydrogenase, partial [Longimicrobiales bacterium]
LSSVARRLKARLDDGLDSFAAMNACQEHLRALADAHAERAILECFHEHIKNVTDRQTERQQALQQMLGKLAALVALHAIERDRAWFLESDYLEAGKSKAIRQEVLDLCAELAPSALTLVNGFGIPDSLVRAPIAS